MKCAPSGENPLDARRCAIRIDAAHHEDQPIRQQRAGCTSANARHVARSAPEVARHLRNISVKEQASGGQDDDKHGREQSSQWFLRCVTLDGPQKVRS